MSGTSYRTMLAPALFTGASACKARDSLVRIDSARGSASFPPSTAATTPTTAPRDFVTEPPPSAISALSEHAEDPYDAVTSGKWAIGLAIRDSLDRSASALPSDSRTGVLRTQLPAVLDSLRAAGSTRELANRVTYVSAKMTAQYASAAVPLLDQVDAL